MKPCPKDSQLVVTGSSRPALSSHLAAHAGALAASALVLALWVRCGRRGCVACRCAAVCKRQLTAVRQPPESRDPMMNEPRRQLSQGAWSKVACSSKHHACQPKSDVWSGADAGQHPGSQTTLELKSKPEAGRTGGYGALRPRLAVHARRGAVCHGAVSGGGALGTAQLHVATLSSRRHSKQSRHTVTPSAAHRCSAGTRRWQAVLTARVQHQTAVDAAGQLLRWLGKKA